MKTIFAVAFSLLAAPVALAQVPDDISRASPPIATTITAQDRARERATRVQDLAGVRAELAAAEARRTRLEAELKRAGKDRNAIARALLESARRSQDMEGDIAEIQTRLDALETDRTRIRASLAGRQDALIEVIAALQRMGTNPPPALLVKPEDALSAVRSALLLGAVVPQVRAQAQALQVELEALARTGQAIATEKVQQAQALEQLAEDEARLALLAEEKADGLGTSSADIQQAVAEVTGLAEKATSLEALIAALDDTIDEAARIASAARDEDSARVEGEQKRLALAREKLQSDDPAGALPDTMLSPALDPDRREPAVAFEKARGMLPLPVEGQPVFAFGDMLAVGTTRRIRSPNAALATAPGTVVRAPADGRVVYAGPFRSFGHVLILDAGDSYHIVLSGMGRVDVLAQSFVVAGQPVGAMGATATRRASVIAQNAAPLGLNAPVLYVEFRKGGRPVDPAPWWAARQVSANE